MIIYFCSLFRVPSIYSHFKKITNQNKIVQSTNIINKRTLMKKGLLSPSSITNCQFFPPTSPSNKSLHSTNLDDSFSTLNCSYLKESLIQNSKFYSFKKIKQDRIKQKNEQGRIIKQMIYKKSQNKRNRLNTLDDVKTIESHNSPRSSISAGKPPKIQQSIIIKRGRDLESQISDQDRKKSFLDQDQQPQTPFFQKRNSYNEEKHIKTDFLKPVSVNPILLKSIQSGLIFHFEVTKYGLQMYKRMLSVHHQGVLTLYSVFPLKSCSNDISLIIYEPYTETLIEHLLKAESIAYKQVIIYMIELVKILSFLRNQCIYPQIEPTTVLLSHDNLKIKLRVNPNSSQREALRECGYYFSLLFKSLLNGYSPTPSSVTRRISGLTINKRLEFENLMNEFIRVQDFNLDEAYLKLQTINF